MCAKKNRIETRVLCVPLRGAASTRSPVQEGWGGGTPVLAGGGRTGDSVLWGKELPMSWLGEGSTVVLAGGGGWGRTRPVTGLPSSANRQTCKNIISRRTSHAGGNDVKILKETLRRYNPTDLTAIFHDDVDTTELSDHIP